MADLSADQQKLFRKNCRDMGLLDGLKGAVTSAELVTIGNDFHNWYTTVDAGTPITNATTSFKSQLLSVPTDPAGHTLTSTEKAFLQIAYTATVAGKHLGAIRATEGD